MGFWKLPLGASQDLAAVAAMLLRAALASSLAKRDDFPGGVAPAALGNLGQLVDQDDVVCARVTRCPRPRRPPRRRPRPRKAALGDWQNRWSWLLARHLLGPKLDNELLNYVIN